MPMMIFWFLFFCCSGLTALSQQPYLQHFTVDDGLPSNELYQVLQDTTGHLLIASDRGAVRYDGYSFEDIPHRNQQNSRPVYYIYASGKRGIFFSSLQGKIFHYRNDSLYDYRFNNKTAQLFNHPGILIANSIATKQDTLWISFNNDFNYNYKVGSCYATLSGDVRKIEKPDGIYFDLGRMFFYRQLSLSSMQQTKQPVYITWPDGAVTTDEIDLTWQGGYIRRLFYERFDDYHLFSTGRWLHVYKDRKKISSQLFTDNVLTLTPLDNGRYGIGFENSGAAVFQLEGGQLIPTGERFLEGYSVTCLYRDNQQGLWLSTLENGLFYYPPSQPRLWEDQSRIVFLDKRKNSIYIGYQSGKIAVFSENKLTETLQVPLPSGTHLLRCAFLHNDSIVAITSKGYYYRKENNWQFEPGWDLLLLSFAPDLLLGASTATADLHVYEGLGKSPRVKHPLAKRIISMYGDSQGNGWIGTWEGLMKYIEGRVVDFSSKSPVFRDRIVSIGELPGGQLVVASLGNGLAVYHKGRIYTLSTKNGLRSNIINNMVTDGRDIWIGTNKGLSMARFENGRFRVIHAGLEAGLPSLDINQFTVSNGWLYIKWVNRLLTINTTRLVQSNENTRTKITSVITTDKGQTLKAGNNLHHHQNALTFNFTAVHLSAARQQEYMYKLEGFDLNWHRTRERYTKYTNLPPGNYRFIVQAVNLQNGTLSAPDFYKLTINPAFWQRWWFPFLAVGLVVLLLIAVFQRRLNAIKEKNTLLLDLAENRQKVLVQLIHPHFVFNVLNTIQGAVLKQDKMVAASLIARFAKLMRLSMELSKEKWVKLEKETDLLNRYFELEEIRSPDRFSYAIEALPPVDPSAFLIPSMLIQPFVENAIKHGVMHLAGRKGNIHIRLWLEKGALLCQVDDNGIGRRESERINKKQREDHESSGIEITLHRLRLLHREQNTTFVYEITDKLNEQGEPAGTAILFSIPYKKSHGPDESSHYRR